MKLPYGCPICNSPASMRKAGRDEAGKQLWDLLCPNKKDAAHNPPASMFKSSKRRRRAPRQDDMHKEGE